MTSSSSLLIGDPRRVIESAQSSLNGLPTELLWGTDTPEESLAMAEIIVNKGFLTITLNERGARSFTYLKGASAGAREVYFVNWFDMGTLSEAPMLLGHFIFELEGCPTSALRFIPGHTNRIYFKGDEEKQDRRVASYNLLSREEVADTRQRLLALSQRHPEHGETIQQLLGFLP